MHTWCWNVVGNGNVASVLVSRLTAQHQKVRCVPRSHIRQKYIPLSVRGHTEFNGEIETYQHSLHASEPHQIWILPLKAWQLSDAITEHAQGLLHAEAILFSHNGLGAAQESIQRLENIPQYDWVTTHGAFRQHQTVQHSGYGESWIGPRNNNNTQCPEFIDILNQALPPFNWDLSIQTRRWQKLAINCAINPLAAREKLLNGALLGHEFRNIIEGVCNEIAQILTIELPNSGLNTEQLVTAVYKTIELTQENTNSMLQDLNHGRLTEIDYLNGYVIKKGQELNVPTPFNTDLFNSIKQL